ncbi:MAG: hypothetical protein CMN30_30070 [Sandaracinus sp.]|nr:hypothetical protein [Sandaracinus sp.]MAR55921.1 hypothetical protein [Rickettsiales bacterium]
MRALSLSLLMFSLACGDDGRRGGDAPVDFGPPEPLDGSVADAAVSPDLGPRDAGSPAAEVDLTFGGTCAPRFDGDVVVVRNAESIAISATDGGALEGSVQLDLDGAGSTETLSSQHRVDTAQVVNVITDTTWTNLAMDSGSVLGGSAPDPIAGTLTIADYRPADGVLDVTFAGVVLQNPSDGSLCEVDGRLRTFRLSF